MNIVLAMAQGLVVMLVAPFFSGLARVIRAKMHNRRGPSILQDYRDLAKLMARPESVSSDSSFVLRIMPPLFLAVSFMLAMGMKQVVVVAWFTSIFIPWGEPATIGVTALVGAVVFLVKCLVDFVVCGVLENSVSRSRFKVLGNQTWAVVGIAVLAFVFVVVGV